MNNKTDKIKSIISEAKALDRFLLSRGIDPRFVTTDQKVSHAKSGEFLKWLQDRKVEQIESEDELIEQQTAQQKFKSGLKKSGYDPDKGAKRLTDIIAKQKKEREEHEKQYGHLYAKEGTDYSLVKGQSNNQYKNDVKLSNGYVTKVAKQPKDDYDRKVDKYLKKKYNKEEVEIKEESIDESSPTSLEQHHTGHYVIHKNSGNRLGTIHAPTINRNSHVAIVNGPRGSDERKEFPSFRDAHNHIKKTYGLEDKSIKEEHLVHVSDGSKYDNEPDAKDTEHVMAGIKKHGGTYDGASDKGAYFKFKSHEDAKNFKKHVDSCPNRSCHADLHEGILDFMKKPNKKQDAIHYIKVNNALKTTPSGKHIMKFPDRESAERHAAEHKKMNPNHNVKVTTDRGTEDPTWHGGTKTRAYSYGMREESQIDEVKEPTGQLKDACWKGYTAVGMKMKNGKKVPNCVPTKESFEEEHGISDKKERSKSARIIKSIYKRKNMKEDIYDHEKDDKSTVVYGKKPKMSNMDDKAGMGENKPEAAAVMSGGTTLTGQSRDIVEIDPMMRKRPGQPDPTKK